MSTDIQKRILELDMQSKQARDFAAGEGVTASEWLKAGLEIPHDELIKEAESAERKAKTLRDYERFEEQITMAEKAPAESVNQAELQKAKTILETNKPAIEAITSKELSSFVKIDKKTDSFTIDVAGAVKTGVDPEKLKALDISGAKQQMVKIRIRKEREEAKESSKVARETRQIVEATNKLKDYIDPKSKALDVERAIKDGVPYQTIKQANYSLEKPQYDSIADYQKASGEGRFNLLIKSGAIPKDSVYAGTDQQGNPTFYTRNQKDVIDKLEKYDYNIPLMLKQNIITEKSLLNAGLPSDALMEAKRHVKASKETGVALEGENKYLRDWYKDFAKAEIALNEKISQIESSYPTYSEAKINTLVKKTTEYKHVQEINSQLDPLKAEQSQALRGTIDIVSFILPPAKSAKPEYTIKDVTALEWGIAAANVAVMVVPMVSPATTAGITAVRGTQLVAGGIYTYDTTKNWSNMSATQRCISVGIDTIIIGSALLPFVGPIARATGQRINSVKANFNTTVTKSQDMISNLFKKSPVKTTGVTPMKQLTEGGVIGPYKNFTDTKLVNAVANGEKPIALITNIDNEAIAAVKSTGLKLKYSGKVQLNPGDIMQTMGKDGITHLKVTKPTVVKEYIVYADNPTSRLALDKLNKAALIDRTTPDGLIKYHSQVGEALGYKPKDIRAFIDNWAATDAGVKEAWDNIKYAMSLNDKTMLRQAAARLQIAAGRLPKQIGEPIIERAKLMQANPDEWLSLTEKAPNNPGDVSKGLDANKQFIENAEQQLRKVSSAKRRDEIVKALEEARQQVKKTAVKTKVEQPFRKVITPEELGKNLPDILKQTDKTVTIGNKKIPLREFTKTPIKTIVKKYKVNREALIEKISTLPIGDRIVIYSQNIPGLSRKERLKIIPMVLPDLPMPGTVYTDIQPQTATRTATKTGVKTMTVIKDLTKPVPETRTKPQTKPKPSPTISPVTTVKPVPKVSPKTSPKPSVESKTVTKLKKKTKVVEKTKKKVKGSEDKDTEWTSKDLKSAIAWKDGFNVIALKYPYRRGVDEKSFHISNVPPELNVVNIKGKGSQQATLKLKGTLREPRTVDVGFEDVTITPIGKGRARITHRRDTKGTVSNMTVKRTLSKKRGKLFHTNAGGGEMISRRPISGY